MEFIHEGNFFLAYWEFVTTWNIDKQLQEKRVSGIPDHVWRQIPDDIKPVYKKDKTKI